MPRMDTPRPRAQPPILDMTPEGEFRDAPAMTRASWLDRVLARVGGIALLAALTAGGLALVAIALVFLGLMLPVALVAGLIAFGSLWWRARRMRGQPGAGMPGGAVRFVVVRREG